MGGLETVLRVVVSLGVVLAAMYVVGRGWQRSRGGRAATHAALEVVARQGVGKGASVAVLRLGSGDAAQLLVVGVTEQHVRLLTRADAAALLPQAVPAAASRVVDEITVTTLQVPDVGSTTVTTTTPVAAMIPSPAAPLAAPPGAPSGATHAAPPVAPPAVPTAGPLTGSALSPATWRAAVDALRERTVRS